MTDEQKLENEIQAKGLNAPRCTPELIDSKIKSSTYTMLPSGKCMVCEITLENGFTVRGESCVVSPENFDEVIGQNLSYDNARDKIWGFEAYLLQERNPVGETAKNRLEKEFKELCVKSVKLSEFIASDTFDYLPLLQREMLNQQRDHMYDYGGILKNRLDSWEEL